MEEYVKTIGKISGDLWKVFKAACESWDPKSDEWWSKLSDDMDSVAKRYTGTEYEKYARSYAVDLVYEIERKANTFQKQLEE